MPHNGFDHVAGPVVVQPVLGAGVGLGQAASPERRGAAPAAVDAVFHVEPVLDHVRVWIDLLVLVARQRLAVQDGRLPVVVVLGFPRGAVAGGAADLLEDLLAPLDALAVEVAGARNRESAVPDQEVVVLVVAHLGREIVPGVVELVRGRVQQVQYGLRDARRRAVGVVRRGRVGLDGRDHVRILRHRLGPGLGGVEVRPVGAADVGDVPDGVGAGAVLQGGARHRVGEALELLRAGGRRGAVGELPLGEGVPRRGGEIVRVFVPEGRIQLHEARLGLVLGLDVLLRDGVEQARADDADGGLEAEGHGLVAGLVGRRVGVEGAARNGHLRIDQFILLPVGEGQRQPALHRADRQPVDQDLLLVDRREEWRHRLGLRHAGHFGHIRAVVAVGAVRRVVDDEQVAVAEAGAVVLLALAVAVAGMAVQAGGAQIGRTEALEGRGVDGEIALERGFAEVEGRHQALRRRGGCLVFVAALGHVERRSQPAGGVPFVGREVPDFLADILGVRLPFRVETGRVGIRAAA